MRRVYVHLPAERAEALDRVAEGLGHYARRGPAFARRTQ